MVKKIIKMKPITFRYYFVLLLLILCIDVNAQSNKIKEGRDFFINGNYPSAVSMLESISITDCHSDCKKLLSDAKQCEKWLEKANDYYHTTDTLNLKRAIDNYKQIQGKRGELGMFPDSVVGKKIEECEERIVRQRNVFQPLIEIPLADGKAENGLQQSGSIRPINNTFKFLPFGIHQLVNKEYGTGIGFFVSEVGLSLGGSFLLKGYNNTIDKYNTEPYQSESRHSSLRSSYRLQLGGAITCFAGAAAMLWWNYCNNFDKNFMLKPIAMSDWQGKPQIGMCLTFNF
jgi:hypothetical protein